MTEKTKSVSKPFKHFGAKRPVKGCRCWVCQNLRDGNKK